MASYLERTYRRLRYGEPIIVVSGLPRSGTSMAMKMLEAGGVKLVADGIRTADEDNPKGYFEDERVKDLAKTPDRAWLRDARGKGIKIISFLIKDLPPSNNYKILFMRRDLEEVLASQTKMLARRGETSDTEDQRMLQLWKDHLRQVGFFLRRRPWLDAIELGYRETLDDPRAAAVEIRRFLNLPLDLDKMAGVVDRKLYRNRR